MRLENQGAGLRKVRVRLTNLGAPLLVEMTATVALVAGLLWLTRTYSRFGDIAVPRLSLGLCLLTLIVSGSGMAANLGPYHLGKRRAQKVFARFPQLEGARWDRAETGLRPKKEPASWRCPGFLRSVSC
jgi:hypothetical protein